MAIVPLLTSLIVFPFHSLQVLIIVALNFFPTNSGTGSLTKAVSVAGFYSCIRSHFDVSLYVS